MYASGLGALQLARVGMLVKESAPGIPAIAPVSADEVRRHVVATPGRSPPADAARPATVVRASQRACVRHTTACRRSLHT